MKRNSVILSLFLYCLLLANICGFKTANDFAIKDNFNEFTPEITEKDEPKKENTPAPEVDKKPTPIDIHMQRLISQDEMTLIDFGKTEILIDVGMKSSSSIFEERFKALLDNYVDGNIEIMVVTHGDSDHCSGFTKAMEVLNKNGKQVEQLIHFDVSKDDSVLLKDDIFKGQLFNEFRFLPATLVDTIKADYTAAQCTASHRDLSDEQIKGIPAGAKEVQTFYGENGAELEFRVLYNYYYDHHLLGKDSEGKPNIFAPPSAASKNVISVCTLITYKAPNVEERMLFCGDLEEYDSKNSYAYVGAESKLIDLNPILKEKPIMFFKASHHGSKTSNSEYFVNAIRPQYVGICADAFPENRALIKNKPLGHPWAMASERVMQNFTKFTDYIHITNRYAIEPGVEIDYKDLTTELWHGDMDFRFDGENVTINGLAPRSIFEDNYFQAFYDIQVSIVNFNNLFMDVKFAIPVDGNCTLIKFGHIDILINAGISRLGTCTGAYIEKIKQYCNDGVLDYLIVSCNTGEYFNSLYSDRASVNGLLIDPYFKKIVNFFQPYYYNDVDTYTEFKDTIAECVKDGKIVNHFLGYGRLSSRKIILDEYSDTFIEFLKTPYDYSFSQNFYENSIAFTFNTGGKTYLNVGSNFVDTISNGSNSKLEEGSMLKKIFDLNNQLNGSVNYYQYPVYGQCQNKYNPKNPYRMPFVKAIHDPNDFICLHNYIFRNGGYNKDSQAPLVNYYEGSDNNNFVIANSYCTNLGSGNDDNRYNNINGDLRIRLLSHGGKVYRVTPISSKRELENLGPAGSLRLDYKQGSDKATNAPDNIGRSYQLYP